MRRLPALILLALMFGALIWAERGYLEAQRLSQNLSDSYKNVDDFEYLGSASEVLGANGSTWHCPAGFTTPDALNDHIVIVSNPTDVTAHGRITMFPALLNTRGNTVPFDRAAELIEVPPRSQRRYSLASQVGSLDPLLGRETGAFVGAVVEFEEAGVTVEHQITSVRDIDIGACASSAGESWWLASGTTSADSAYQLYLLNPFADDAVVDVAFVTDDGRRTPTIFDSRLVPARSLSVLQVSPVVTLWDQIAAEVNVLSGRVIAERLQILGGDGVTAGVSTAMGSNRLSTQWFFPAGGALGVGSGETYLIMNPNDESAQIEFEAKPDGIESAGEVAPISLTIGPRKRWAVTIRDHATHPSNVVASIDATSLVPQNEGYFVSVRSFNSVPITVERVYTAAAVVGNGATATLGADVAATEALISIPRRKVDGQNTQVDQGSQDTVTADENQSELTGMIAVLNPAGDTISQVRVYVGREDGVEELVTQVELAQRRRAVFTLDSLGATNGNWVRVESSTPTITELVTSGQRMTTSSIAVPQKDTVSVPDILAFD